jgi:photosystem II stability/assembly factor-like uncharacterized protein
MVGMMERARWGAVLVMLCGLGCAWAASAQDLHQVSGPWVMEKSGTTAGLRGIHAVGGGVAWASGTNGTVLRTEDGGYEWQSCAMPPGAEKLDFRGVWAWDDNTAMVMSSGTGDASRIYKTVDGCSSWKLLYTNPDKDGFWDAMVAKDQQTIEVLGDPVGGRFVDIGSEDGGKSWRRVDDPRLRSLPKEGAFAASNSSLAEDWDDGLEYFGTGGPEGARLFDECDPCKREAEFVALSMPMFPKGESSGIFSIGYRFARNGRLHLAAVGGDYMKPNDSTGTAAWSTDGGKTWTAAAKLPHGFRSAVAWDADLKAWIAAGTNGSDISYDDGRTWVPLDGSETGGNWNALSLPWVVGPGGRIAKLDAGKIKK